MAHGHLKTGLRLFGAVCVLALLFCACGPIKSTIMIQKAEKAMKTAENADAGAYTSSVYDYWTAKSYLQKAKEEHGYSEFEPSENFAREAYEYATDAAEKAKGEKVYEPKLDEGKTKGGKSKKGESGGKVKKTKPKSKSSTVERGDSKDVFTDEE